MPPFAFIPATFRVIFIFSLVLYMIRRKSNPGTALSAGAFLLAILFVNHPLKLSAIFLETLLSEEMFSLECMVISLIFLSNLMKKTGNLENLVNSFSFLVSSQNASLIFFPAMVGLLPMPGGAVFSCPMLEKAAENSEITASRLAAINYWFRHMWEFCWPLYPALLLTASLVPRLSPGTYLAYQFPLAVLSFLTGYYFLIRPINKGPGQSTIFNEKEMILKKIAAKELMTAIMPVIIIIISYLILNHPVSVPLASFISRYFSHRLLVMPGILLAILYVILNRKNNSPFFYEAIMDPVYPRMAFTVAGIVLFSGIMERSGAAKMLASEFASGGIPVSGVVVTLPFLTGLISGITIASTGISLPVILALYGAKAGEVFPVGVVIMAYTSGLAGVLLSPLHLCLILTADYFRVSQKEVILEILPPVISVFTGGLLLFFLLS